MLTPTWFEGQKVEAPLSNTLGEDMGRYERTHITSEISYPMALRPGFFLLIASPYIGTAGEGLSNLSINFFIVPTILPFVHEADVREDSSDTTSLSSRPHCFPGRRPDFDTWAQVHLELDNMEPIIYTTRYYPRNRDDDKLYHVSLLMDIQPQVSIFGIGYRQLPWPRRQFGSSVSY